METKLKFVMRQLNFSLKNVQTFHYGEQVLLQLFTAVFLITMIMNCITSSPSSSSCFPLFVSVDHQDRCDLIIFILFFPKIFFGSLNPSSLYCRPYFIVLKIWSPELISLIDIFVTLAT
jgi:hypothetical protein